MPQQIWSGHHEKAELWYKAGNHDFSWKTNASFVGLNQDKSLNPKPDGSSSKQHAALTSEPIYALPWMSSGAAYAGLPQHVISS